MFLKYYLLLIISESGGIYEMKKIVPALIFFSLILIVPLSNVMSSEIQESTNMSNRPFYFNTVGVTQQRSLLTFGWIFIQHMMRPWPDQTYSTLLGIIFYEEGHTIIYHNETNEVFSADGPHTLIFYKFYGTTSSVDKRNVSFEGNAVYAKIIGG